MVKVGIVGGRGYVGEELLRLLIPHPRFEIVYVGSSSMNGQRIDRQFSDLPANDLVFESTEVDNLPGREVDLWILAQSNGRAKVYVDALCRSKCKFVDISADYRFDDDWIYGLTERNTDLIRSATRIANPGCYATGTQLALLPVLDQIAEPPHVFGVSGFSGAGRKPSEKNDPQRLGDNLLPYRLTGHGHELEISHQLGQAVNFTPHVAQFFRGISLTISVTTESPRNAEQWLDQYQTFYADSGGVAIVEDIPEIADVRGTHRCAIGGFQVDARDPRRAVLVCVLDNLRKGAATQAVQNMNLMCGFDFWEGLHGD